MAEYQVKNQNAPFFVWQNNQQKSRAGNLWAGYKVNGSVSGSRLIIAADGNEIQDGEHQSFCMYMTDLEPVPTEPPPPEPPPASTRIVKAIIYMDDGTQTELRPL